MKRFFIVRLKKNLGFTCFDDDVLKNIVPKQSKICEEWNKNEQETELKFMNMYTTFPSEKRKKINNIFFKKTISPAYEAFGFFALHSHTHSPEILSFIMILTQKIIQLQKESYLLYHAK